ncbi:MAG TPA: hypothetical protein VEA59_02780 [Patescibacteria group bacterium]|nr:hypothetical protein [Patescibacteria group bacterium]
MLRGLNLEDSVCQRCKVGVPKMKSLFLITRGNAGYGWICERCKNLELGSRYKTQSIATRV